MKMSVKLATALIVSASVVAHAGQKEEYNELRTMTNELIIMLVQEGIISENRAKDLVKRVQDMSDKDIADDKWVETEVVKVPYVPDFIKDEIKSSVRNGLREDVVDAVMGQAKTQQWGIPNALPEWTRRFSFKGDLRLRHESLIYADGNSTNMVDYNKVNDAGELTGDSLIEANKDRHRQRLRARLAVKAKVDNSLAAKLRLATGNASNPVSTNQSLRSGGGYELFLDRAYLDYKGVNIDAYNWLDVKAGRMSNPWHSTNLSWDGDLAFDGVAITYKKQLGGGDTLFEMDDANKHLFATLGAFPLEEYALSSADRWLFGAQIGFDMTFDSQSTLRTSIAYYDYHNIEGRSFNPDELARDRPNHQAPKYMQRGNTLYNIGDGDSNSPAPDVLYALASDYNIIDWTLTWDIARFAPHHIIVEANVVKNIGYDEDDIQERVGTAGLSNNNGDLIDDTTGYQLSLEFGWPYVAHRGDWSMEIGYRYLEQDAVIDGFTDSDFHLGGTDAKGYFLSGKYGLTENTYFNLKYMSTSSISMDKQDDAQFDVDTIQLDVVAKF